MRDTLNDDVGNTHALQTCVIDGRVGYKHRTVTVAVARIHGGEPAQYACVERSVNPPLHSKVADDKGRGRERNRSNDDRDGSAVG